MGNRQWAMVLVALPSAMSAQRPVAANRVDIVAVNDSTFRITGAPVAGMVEMRFTNRTSDIQSAHLVAVAQGRSPDEAAQQLRANQPVPWMGNAGGPGVLSPNRTASVTQELPPGEYFVIGRRAGRDGRPRHMNGMLGRFTVTGVMPRTPDVRIDARITLEARFQLFRIIYSANGREQQLTEREYRQEFGHGPRVLRIENTGGLFHEVVILYSRGSRPHAMSAFAANRPLPEGVVVVGGVGYLPPGARVWLNIEMVRGSYMFFCPLRHRDGTPGHMLGEQVSQSIT